MLILDTPGESIHLTSVAMTATVFALIVFDVSDKKSFDNLDGESISKYNQASLNENRIIYIVGTKTDKGTREVTEEQGR